MKPSILHRLRKLQIITMNNGANFCIGSKRKRHGTHGAFGKSIVLKMPNYFRQEVPDKFKHSFARGMDAFVQIHKQIQDAMATARLTPEYHEL